MSLSFRVFAKARGFALPDFPTVSLRAVYGFVYPTAPANPISLRKLLQSGGPVEVIGNLSLSLSPTVFPVGEELQLVVTATDPHTGTNLTGLPVMVADQFYTSNPSATGGPWTPQGPLTKGTTRSPFAFRPPGPINAFMTVLVLGAPWCLDTSTRIYLSPPTPPATPAPQISTANGPDGQIIVTGKYFPSPTCSIARGDDGWGDVTGGPWTGNILDGILITTPCDNPLGGQSYSINITSAGNSYTFTINC